MDKIVICDLELAAQVGVTAEEQAVAQRLLVGIEMELDLNEAGRTDEISATVDYAAVADVACRTVAARPRKLIESVAYDVAQAVLRVTGVRSVTVEVKKFSVPAARYVSARMTCWSS